MLRRTFVTRVSLALSALIGTALCVGRLTPSQAQDATTPVAEIGLSKNLEGQVKITEGHRYKCQLTGKTVEMITMPVSLYFTTSSSGRCDELPRMLNGKMGCKWNVVLRTDEKGFGTHRGTFRWEDSVGNVVEGDMHGTIGCGTHRSPGVHAAESDDCEGCRVPYHVEGLLIGEVVAGPIKREFGRAVLNASYAGSLRGESLTSIKGAVVSLDGVTMVPCRMK